MFCHRVAGGLEVKVITFLFKIVSLYAMSAIKIYILAVRTCTTVSFVQHVFLFFQFKLFIDVNNNSMYKCFYQFSHV